MQRIILTMMLAVFSASLFAQSFDDVKKFAVLQRWEDAKGAVDKYLAVEKNAKNAEAWYYKGNIYSELAKLPKYADSSFRMDAFDAYKKYQEMDPKNSMMKDNENVEFFGLYNGYFDDGISQYNAKKYGKAFDDFKNALIVEGYVKGKNYSYKGYSFPSLDTQLIQNTALAAYLNKDSANAAVFYEKLADAKLKSPTFIQIYEYLAEYFAAIGDTVNMNKYFALGKELYPDNEYWEDFEWKQAGNDRQKQEQVLAKYPNSYALYYNYAAQLFNAIYTVDPKPANYTDLQKKLDTIATKAIAINANGVEAILLMARHDYNEIYDLQDAIAAIKGTKPDDVKKKNDLSAQMDSKYEEMMKYASKASDILEAKGADMKPVEKGSLKVATNLIISYWEYKKDADKVKQYQDKMKSIN